MLTDIQGLEDFLGDMDFKVAGTVKGITAIQMDIKIAGIDARNPQDGAGAGAATAACTSWASMLETLAQPRDASEPRMRPRSCASPSIPRRFGEVIGPGGKMINKIIAETGVKIDIEDDGRVFIVHAPMRRLPRRPGKIIEGIAKDIEVGDVFTGKVVRIMNFGAFVELRARQGRHDPHLQAGRTTAWRRWRTW